MYTQEDFRRELGEAISPLSSAIREGREPGISTIVSSFHKGGKLIAMAQEHLTQQELWATFDQVGLSRQDAFYMLNHYMEGVAAKVENAPIIAYQMEPLERSRALNREIEAGTLPNDLIEQKWVSLNREHLELCRKRIRCQFLQRHVLPAISHVLRRCFVRPSSR